MFNPTQPLQTFFTTALEPCCYLENRLERKILTELNGENPVNLHESLSQRGFRRSHAMAYAPACPHCQACVPVRIRVQEFTPNRTMRRTMRHNQDLTLAIQSPQATLEQFELFQIYQQERHPLGDMAMMSPHDYQAMIEDTPIHTLMVQLRHPNGELVAACLTDVLADGLSAVYSFYHPALEARSLGSYMILQLVQTARLHGLPYVYLGYWIDGSPKMTYKTLFQPLDYFTAETGWTPNRPGSEPSEQRHQS